MTTNFEKHHRQKLLHHAQRLADALADQVDYPTLLLAFDVWQVYLHGLAVCGNDLQQKQLEWMTEVLRDHSGFCQYCDNQIDPSLTHPPVCRECDERLDREVDEMLKDPPHDSGGAP